MVHLRILSNKRLNLVEDMGARQYDKGDTCASLVYSSWVLRPGLVACSCVLSVVDYSACHLFPFCLRFLRKVWNRIVVGCVMYPRCRANQPI